MEIKKKQISAQIVADSINPQGDRITTFLLTYPRFIHGELMTHRVFSRNSASSRAIPFEKMVKMVEEDPFIPIAWQKDHKGMQGNEYITDQKIIQFKTGVWLNAKRKAVESAEELHYNVSVAKSMDDIKELDDTSVTKQICNRLLEPFMWHTVLVTATEYDNFFELRCPQYGNDEQGYFKSKKDTLKHLQGRGVNITNLLESTDIEWQKINKSQAEIHIQALAEAMWDTMNESTPNQLKSGDWHTPFNDQINKYVLKDLLKTKSIAGELNESIIGAGSRAIIKIATARCARLSYMTFDGEIDYNKDIELHDRLLQSGHYSPFEHCAKAMSDEEYTSFIKGRSNANWNTDLVTDDTYEISAQFDNTVLGWCNNFKGFIPYRYLIEAKKINNIL